MTVSDAIIARFMGLHPKKIDLSLDRVETLLARLGHPERRLPPVIHVAGTNGKGSTIAFARAALEAAGYGVHVYTSPHLIHFHERIRLAAPGGGRLVAEERLVEALQTCEQLNVGDPITVFEITTAAAFKLFAENPADILLLEVGLGGRMDATNVVRDPLLTIITSVSLDHADFLGTDLGKIAEEKAGILKREVPAILHPQLDPARAAIERAAARLCAPVIIGGQDFDVREEHGRLVYQDEAGLLDLPLPRLIGRHQHRNAGVAIAALRAQDRFRLADRHFERAMQSVDWPARLQRLSGGRIPAMLPPGTEVWLDGSHNADGGRVLAEALGEFEERNPRPLLIVAGMLSSKDSDGFLVNFAGLAREVHAVAITGAASRSPEEVAAAARQAGLVAHAHPSLAAAIASIGAQPHRVPPRLVIAGSLYLAGEVLALNGTELS
jgi:dihydrofolate synthase/folylpolyglutamate synthase